jgi:hypothetical protein
VRYTYRDKRGRFSKPTVKNRLFNEAGREIFGAAKRAVTKRVQAQRRKKPVRRKAQVPSAVPRKLSRTFAWFVENLDNVSDNSMRTIYAICTLIDENTYGRLANIAKDDVIPVALPRRRVGVYKRMSKDELLTLARRSYGGDGTLTEVIAIVAKKKNEDLKKRNNPLVKARIRAAKKAREPEQN